jgi:hypothetical protein
MSERLEALPQFVVPVVAGVVTAAITVAVVLGAVGIRETRAEFAADDPVASSSPGPIETPIETPTSTPTPTPGDIAPTGIAPPTQPLGGDCATLATEDQLSDAAGTSISFGPYEDSDLDGLISTTVNATWEFAELQAGALHCFWHGGADESSVSISAGVFPGGVLSERRDEDCGDIVSNDGYNGENDCIISRFANGSQLIAAVYSRSRATSQEVATQFISLFDAAAASAAPVTKPAVDPSVWPLGINCAADHPATVDGENWVFSQARIGYGGGPGDIFQELVGSTTKDTLYCAADLATQNPDDPSPTFIQYAVYGGGAWVFDEYTGSGATEVTVPGFDRAALVPTRNGDEQGFLLLVRGTNLLSVAVYGRDPESTFAVSAAFADALDATR